MADERGGFEQCNHLVSLMGDTSRRVKVVFAGLHNVLRFTERANHPLAHLGLPIQVGPLIREQSRDGRALIEEPFAALGFRFDPPALASLIRFHTNSYPSLLQLYGRTLLTDLNRNRQYQSDGPPYTVNRADVDATYRSDELREAVRGKFELTLRLDPRYALLTYLIAYNTLCDGSEGLRDGYDVEAIREEALAFWEDGFRGSARIDDFAALLDELDGLGVLQRVASEAGLRRYALRSPNLLQLLGSEQELGHKIEQFEQHEQPPAFNRATYRTAVRKDHHDFRAPLTAEQADAFLGQEGHRVVVVVGSPSSGLDDVAGFLEHEGANLVVLADLVTPDGERLVKRLDEIWKGETGLPRGIRAAFGSVDGGHGPLRPTMDERAA